MAGFSILAKLGLDSSKFKKGLTANQTALSKFGKAIGNVVKAGAAIATAAFSAFAVKGVKDLITFKKSMAEVFTLLPGISKDSMGQMESDVRNLATAMGVDLMDATKALYQAISAGVPKENVFEFMEVASKAAIGGVTSLETAVDGITSVINTYGRENITAKEASDAMFTAVKLGKTTFDELSGSLFNVLPIAKQANVSFDEISAALAVMTAKGTPTSVATTQLRQAITSLIAPTTKTVKHFETYGLSVANLKALMAGGDGGLVKAMQNVMIATNGDETAIRKLVGSTEAMNAILTLTSGNARSFGVAMVSMMEKTGATDAAYKTMAQTVAHNLNKMLGNLKDLGIEFGAAFLPLINNFLPTVSDSFKELVPKIKDFAKEFPLLVKDITNVVVVFGKFAAAIVTYTIAAKLGAVVLGTLSVATALFKTRATAATAATVTLSAATKANIFGLLASGAVGAAYALKTFIDTASKVEGLAFVQKWFKEINDEIARNKREAEGAADRIKLLDDRLKEFAQEDFANEQLHKGVSLLDTQLDLRKKELLAAEDSARVHKDKLDSLKKRIWLQNSHHAKEIKAAKEIEDKTKRGNALRFENLQHARNLGRLEADRNRMEEEWKNARVNVRDLTKEIKSLEEDITAEIVRKVKIEDDAAKALADKEARRLAAAKDIKIVLAAVNREHELSKTAAGQLILMDEARDQMLVKRAALIDDINDGLDVEGDLLADLEQLENDILTKTQDIDNHIKNNIKAARDAEIQQVKDLVAELDKALQKEKEFANAAGDAAGKLEDEVKALRGQFKEAEKGVDEQRKFWDVKQGAFGKTKVTANLKEMRGAWKEARAGGFKGTFKDFEDLKKKEMQEAIRKREDVRKLGQNQKEVAEELRELEQKALEDAANIEKEIIAEKERIEKIEQDIRDEEKKAAEDLIEAAKDLKDAAKDLKEDGEDGDPGGFKDPFAPGGEGHAALDEHMRNKGFRKNPDGTWTKIIAGGLETFKPKPEEFTVPGGESGGGGGLSLGMPTSAEIAAAKALAGEFGQASGLNLEATQREVLDALDDGETNGRAVTVRKANAREIAREIEKVATAFDPKLAKLFAGEFGKASGLNLEKTQGEVLKTLKGYFINQ